MTEWKLAEETKLLPPIDKCPDPQPLISHEYFSLELQRASKPSFQNHVRELVHNHDLAILIVMETRIGGERARDITDRLPFDGAIHTDIHINIRRKINP